MLLACRFAGVCALALFALVPVHLAAGEEGAVHTVFSTECTPYFTFQSMALAYSYKRVGQPGNLTRIMSCNDEQWQDFDQRELELVQTHRTPQYSVNPVNGDAYSPYNKPCGVMHWLEHARPQEEWILVVDSDIIFRQTFLPEELRIQEGWALAAHYNYMEGGNNPLAMTHVPTVEPRNDTYGGPLKRRADEVGAFYFLRMKDIKKVAPLWKRFTEDVRDDPQAWQYSGDSFAKSGERPWISEMYGWVFGMAQLNIKHVIDPTMQIYAGYAAADIPRLIHYGLDHSVLNYSYDKHNHVRFDAFMCPPWDLETHRSSRKDGGLFPHPPYPHELPNSDSNGKFYGDLVTIEFVNTINQALCERHRRVCPGSEQLEKECGRVDAIGEELVQLFRRLDPVMCADITGARCEERSLRGSCIKEWLDMSTNCRATCGLCRKDVPWANTDAPNIDHASQKLHGSLGSMNEQFDQGPFLREKQSDLYCKEVQMPGLQATSICSGVPIYSAEISLSKHSASNTWHGWTVCGLFLIILVGWLYNKRTQKIVNNVDKDLKV